MIPRVSKSGRSFKGIVAYMAHDQDKARSSDRLGFVDVHNIALIAAGHTIGNRVRDMERAGAIMAWTATHQIDLAALHHANTRPGVPFKPPKAPLAAPVYSMSLRFDPADAARINDALLRKAAAGALDTLGMSQCQAIVLQHHDYKHAINRSDIAAPAGDARNVPDDLLRLAARQHRSLLPKGLDPAAADTTPARAALIAAMTPRPDADKPVPLHLDVTVTPATPVTATAAYPKHPPHVHVIVNLVDPTTGKSIRTSYDFLKLSKFAQAFTAEHGLTQIKTRVENNAKRDQRINPNYREIPRSDWELFKSYRGKTLATVTRERAAQQNADRQQIADRHAHAKALLEANVIAPWIADRARHEHTRDEARRRLSASGFFALVTQVRRRLSGQTRADKRAIDAATRSIASLDNRITTYRSSLETAQSADLQRLERRHAAEIARDRKYFEMLRKRADEDARRLQQGLLAAQKKSRRDQGRVTTDNLIQDLGGPKPDAHRTALSRAPESDSRRRLREDMEAAARKGPRNPDRPHRPRKKKPEDDPDPDPPRRRRR